MIFWSVAAVMAFGVFLHAVATLGVIRLPDFYTRMHAVGMGDTLGIGVVLAAVAIAHVATADSLVASIPIVVKLLLIIAFYFIANPTATHAVARAAFTTRGGPDPITTEGRIQSAGDAPVSTRPEAGGGGS